ncbi:MAG: MBL fold metallo-hydrolase [Aerococcus urinaeequi]
MESKMIVKVLASGSEANCVYVSNGTYNILIDIGIQPTKAGKVLADNDINPADLKGVFITHEHKDHVQGLSLANKYKIPVYSMSETIRAITQHEKTPRKIDHPHELPRIGGVTWGLGSKDHMTVRAFKVHHDAFDPVGYTIESGIHKVSVLMDTGKVTEEMIRSMAGSTVYVFECNHDKTMLIKGKYEPSVKQRILSDNGHLSNQAAATALARLVTGKGEQIYLSHMSSNNNDPDKARAAVRAALREKGLVANKHYKLGVV